MPWQTELWAKLPPPFPAKLVVDQENPPPTPSPGTGGRGGSGREAAARAGAAGAVGVTKL